MKTPSRLAWANNNLQALPAKVYEEGRLKQAKSVLLEPGLYDMDDLRADAGRQTRGNRNGSFSMSGVAKRYASRWCMSCTVCLR